MSARRGRECPGLAAFAGPFRRDARYTQREARAKAATSRYTPQREAATSRYTQNQSRRTDTPVGGQWRHVGPDSSARRALTDAPTREARSFAAMPPDGFEFGVDAEPHFLRERRPGAVSSR